jgi:hypothetical protein
MNTIDLIQSVTPGFERWCSTLEIRDRASLKIDRMITLKNVRAALDDLKARGLVESKPRGNGLCWRLK